MKGPTRRPTAFRIGDEDVAVSRDGAPVPRTARVVVEPEPEDVGIPGPPVPKRKSFGWGKVFWGALGALISLAVGLWVDQLVRDLFARNDLLGWVALGLAALAGLAAGAVIVREVVGVARVRRIDALRERAALAAAKDDGAEAAAVAEELAGFYADRPETAKGRRAMKRHLDEVIDGRDLLVLAEHDLVQPFDDTARRLVADAAKRVSVVTAVSPRAVVDIVFVLVAVLGLIRKLADLYGGRPGLIGFLSLTRHVLTHLAVTGGMAIGDGLVQQIVGHGLAARLSARLGEGVVNGLLTARVGLAAIEVCRPLPFLEAPRPGISDVMGGLLPKSDKGEDGPGDR
ncbi:YcjF family protein [Chthonobacter rhizosphaerae]|uniref:YcjF family protein n=1 Tax=Chthonobacter rhizosphaerae TaxID=2735553 RepID=UPI0015EF86B4|nr:TIGR01620 family protein [Chthonobacter rhizosphaerae]